MSWWVIILAVWLAPAILIAVALLWGVVRGGAPANHPNDTPASKPSIDELPPEAPEPDGVAPRAGSEPLRSKAHKHGTS